MARLAIAQGVSTPRTWPPLGFGYPIARAAFGQALTTPLEAPAVPIRVQGGIVRARAAFHLHVADDGPGRHPFASAAAGLATALPPGHRARGAVWPAVDVAAVDPPLRWRGGPAFHPPPPRSPAVVVHVLAGVVAHHLVVVQGPAAAERVQLAQHDGGGDGLLGCSPGPARRPEGVHRLLRGRDPAFLPAPRHRAPEALTALCPLHQAGVLRMARQPPFVATGGDPGACRRDRGPAFGPHDQVLGLPGDPVAVPPRCGQASEGAMRQPWADHAALGGAFRRVGPRAVCPRAGLQPLCAQLPSWPRAEAVQDDVLAARGKRPWAIGGPDVVVVAYGPGVERPVDRLDGLLAAASGANAVAWRVALGFNPRFQGVVAHHVPHPVPPRRAAERPWLPVGRREIAAPHRGRLPGVLLPAGVDQRGTRVGRGHPCPVAPWRLPATGDLGETPDRHHHLGVTAEEPCGPVTDGLPARLLGRPADPHAPVLDAPCRGVHALWDPSVGGEPRSFGACGGPPVRTVSAMAWPASPPPRPGGRQHPCRWGLSTGTGGPRQPLTGWPSRPPTSSTPWAWASLTASGVRGLTPHGASRGPPGGHADAVGSPSAPVEVCPVEGPTPDQPILSTYHFGQSLSAALALSPARGLPGFTM